MNKIVALVVVLIVATLSGCASVPMESIEKDAQAKKFVIDSSKANIYLYRNETFGGAIAMPVALDGKVAGKTGPKTFFHWQVKPGTHEISSLTENTAKITIDTQAGQNHYVWQEVKMGMWTARSVLHEVSPEKGMEGVNECKLLKSDI